MKNIKNEAKVNKNKKEGVLDKGPFCFFIWILKVEFIILLIFFTFGIIFNLIPEKTKFNIKYNIEKKVNMGNELENFNYNQVIKAVEQNNNLNYEEKKYISKILQKEIEENINYIDIKEVIKRLKNVKIIYSKKYKFNDKTNKYEIQNKDIYVMNIAGKYNSFFNELYLYERIDESNLSEKYKNTKFDFSKTDKKVYFHELNHLITKNTISTTMDTLARKLETKNIRFKFIEEISNSIQINNKNIFLETINELFSREYFEYDLENTYTKNNEAYENEMMYAYILAEILPEDIIKRYKFEDNMSILISGLLEIDNNIDEVYKLISSLNSIKIYENKSTELKKQNYKKIHDGFAYFYEKKYNKKMEDDINILLYSYNTPIQTKEERNKIRSFLEMKPYDEIINIIPKGYVSKEYKEKHKNIQVEYTKNGKKEYNIEIWEK